jgi:hypothetical protein
MAKITAKAVKIAILEPVELSPPVIAEILTIDVSTIKAIIMKEIRMKMPFEPIFLWNLFKAGFSVYDLQPTPLINSFI